MLRFDVVVLNDCQPSDGFVLMIHITAGQKTVVEVLFQANSNSPTSKQKGGKPTVIMMKEGFCFLSESELAKT